MQIAVSIRQAAQMVYVGAVIVGSGGHGLGGGS